MSKLLNVCLFACITNALVAKVDVVIPCIEKDLYVLEACINGARSCIQDLGRIIVVSPKQYTDSAEWFNESDYPFSIEDVSDNLGKFGGVGNNPRRGWYYQQLLKLYAPFVIPDISNDVLIIDADTVFLKPFSPVTANGASIFNVWGFGNMFSSYISHMKRLYPGLECTKQNVNPVVNHMIFQRDKLEILFSMVEEYHGKDFWKAFCNCVDTSTAKSVGKSFYVGASEYTIYFFFMNKYFPNDCITVVPKMDNRTPSFEALEKFRKQGYDVVSLHHYYRESNDAKINKKM